MADDTDELSFKPGDVISVVCFENPEEQVFFLFIVFVDNNSTEFASFNRFFSTSAIVQPFILMFNSS